MHTVIHTLSTALVVLVAVEHVYFFVLEAVLWTKPLGRKVFRQTLEQAQITATLAKNQGVYNAFLSAGLLWSLIHPNVALALQLRLFFFGCVVVAGLVGAATFSRRILWVQGMPALVGLFLTGTLYTASP